jgi:hypothetical protein
VSRSERGIAAGIAILAVASFLAIGFALREPYRFEIGIEATGDAVQPVVITGSISSHGLRAFDGTGQFRLMPRPGGVARMFQSTNGGKTIEVYAGLSRDAQIAWWIATIVDGDRVIASKSDVVRVKR